MSQNKTSNLDIIYADDPKVAAAAATDDYSTRKVPDSARSGKWGVTWAWWAIMSGMFYLILAGGLALSFGTKATIIGVTITCITMGILGYFISGESIRTGLGGDLLAKKVLGYTGSFIISLMLGTAGLWYATFEASVMAHSLFSMFPAIPMWGWYAITSAVMVPIVWFGMKFLEKFNGWTIPLYLIGLVAAIVVTYIKTDGGYQGWLNYMPDAPAFTGVSAWFYIVTIYMGLYVWFLAIPEYARYMKKEDAKFGQWVSFGPVVFFLTFLVNGLIGIWLTLSIGKGSDAGIYIPAVMGLAGVVFILITQVRINTANLYLSTVSLSNLFETVFKVTVPRNMWALIAGIAMFLMMLTNVLGWLNEFLRFQGVVMVCWVGVLLPYICFFKKKLSQYDEDSEIRRSHLVNYNRAGIWGTVLGTGVGALMLYLGGPLGAMWSPVAALVISFVVTTIVAYATGLKDYKDQFPGNESLKSILKADGVNASDARVKCSVCGLHYISSDLEICAVSGDPICSVCCGKTTSCKEICKS